ncbi:MAG: N-acetylmuramoyl-L-alanine amidase [bacterium]|nr:N-acetylmuramoyl-L-alanine amidase [bacterium]
MMLKKKNVIYLFLALILTFIPYVEAYAITPLELVNKYRTAQLTGQKVNILIVPGHDDEYSGTEFGDIRESDVVVAIGQYLNDYLKNDPRINVQISRTQMGYNPLFSNYFVSNREQILAFIEQSKIAHQARVEAGEVQQTTSVPHNTAQPEVALRLYGINKWASENNIDIVLHLHVNDMGGRSWGQVGEYTGFSVYIPERQFDHSAVSAVVGEAIFNELRLKNATSTYPAESMGLMEDQDLIAIGARNTLKGAAALIEYGYIYEPQFQELAIQETVTKDFAFQTFLGLHRFFGDRASYALGAPQGNLALSNLPYTWTKNLQKGTSGADVSALQAALTKDGVYTCEVIGNFGPCTETGVKAFQKKYGISQTGTIGPLTRAKLNSLYSI